MTVSVESVCHTCFEPRVSRVRFPVGTQKKFYSWFLRGPTHFTQTRKENEYLLCLMWVTTSGDINKIKRFIVILWYLIIYPLTNCETNNYAYVYYINNCFRFAKDKASFSLSSDDPTLTGRYLNEDYKLAQSWGFNREQFKIIVSTYQPTSR